MRHNPDCGHFEWGDGTILGTPEPATQEQMQTLRACKDCIETSGKSSGDGRHSVKDGKLGKVCPVCSQVMPLTGICDNCADLPARRVAGPRPQRHVKRERGADLEQRRSPITVGNVPSSDADIGQVEDGAAAEHVSSPAHVAPA